MIQLSIPKIDGNEWNYIKECLDTNWVSSVGSYVDLFENNFKDYVGAESSVVTMNGTAALTLALQTLGIGNDNDDEVIVPSMTFVASVNPIIYVGAKPIFVDIKNETWVMDASKIEEAITENTKAIVPVHLYGNMVDMDCLMEIANKYNLYVIEDATESLGSYYKMRSGENKSSGTIGHFGVFSFNGNKIITTGAGGMLVSNDKKLADRAKHLSNQAKTVNGSGGFIHDEIGYNYRMPNILAAMGVAQLETLPEKITAKKEIAAIYDRLLKDITDIRFLYNMHNVDNCRWLYSIIVNDISKRDELIQFLKTNQIESRPFFAPIHGMKPYEAYSAKDMQNTDEVSGSGINLPCYVGIKEDTILYICEKIKEFFNNYRRI